MILYSLLVLILYNSLIVVESFEASICIGICHCNRDTVDCSSLDLAEIPAGIPNNTRVLILSNNEIETIDSQSLKHFHFLHTIDLSNNILRYIDEDLFKNVPNLRVLNLRKNRFSLIPSGIHHSDHLDKLDLRSNLIATIEPDEFDQLASVRYVDLSRNLISFLPKANASNFQKLKTPIIERLDLASNAISEITSDVFLHFSSLVSLRLSRNRIHMLNQFTFSRLPHLESIDLTRNMIREIRFLAFNQLPKLKNVTLAKNDIFGLDDGMFYACENLARLNLSTNRVQSVTEGWMFGLTNLEVLDLSYNQIQSFHTSSWLHTPQLKWLSLHSNRILSLPSGSFRALRHLEELILSANSIDSLHKFALIGMNNLHRLDLSSNTLAVCVEDGAVLYNTSMPFLRSLRFTNNQLRVIPKRAFERFPALEELDITDNPIATIHPEAFEPLFLKRLIMNSSSILCDCQISWFAKFIFDFHLDRTKIVAKCSYPPQFKDLDVVAIDRSNLTCLDDSPRAKIVGQPEEVSALVGERARFTCNLYGEGPLLIEWRVMENGQPRVLVQDSYTFMSINTTAVINGTMDGREFAAAELVLDNVTLIDKSEYQCVGRNRFGSDFSKNVDLHVYQTPTFSNTPLDMSLLAGQNAKFVCSATGTPRPELKWAFDGGLFPAAEARRLYVIPNDDHIYIMNVTTHDQGVYTCHASNVAGQIQASARLRVFDNVFQNVLESKIIQESESTVLECFVGLIPGVQRMVWRKGRSEIHHSSRFRFSADNQMLMLTKSKFSDSGEYSCELWVETTLLSRQTATIKVVSEKEYMEEDSVIYRKATELQAMASKWAETVNSEGNRYTVIIGSLAAIIGMLGICISIFCCTSRYFLLQRQEINQPTFV